MSTCKITYNGNEISAVDETAPVSVAYNSSTIATLNDGDTKTLGCHGKVMASDVVIGSKTLNCGGKLMQGDIVVELVGSAPSGETWYFNDTINATEISYTFNFASNGKLFTSLLRSYRITSLFKMDVLVYTTSSESKVKAYDVGSWAEQAYRTIVLEEPASGELLTWLEANATKLS